MSSEPQSRTLDISTRLLVACWFRLTVQSSSIQKHFPTDLSNIIIEYSTNIDIFWLEHKLDEYNKLKTPLDIDKLDTSLHQSHIGKGSDWYNLGLFPYLKNIPKSFKYYSLFLRLRTGSPGSFKSYLSLKPYTYKHKLNSVAAYFSSFLLFQELRYLKN